MKKTYFAALAGGILVAAIAVGQIKIPQGKDVPGGGTLPNIQTPEAISPSGKTAPTCANVNRTFSVHDNPVVVSDNSIRITLNNLAFADLAGSDAASYTANNLGALDPDKTLMGALISHTHATCPQQPPVSSPVPCSAACVTHVYPSCLPYHTLDVTTKRGAPIQPPFELTDCDTIVIGLSQSVPLPKPFIPSRPLSWIPSRSSIVIKKRYFPVSAYVVNTHPTIAAPKTSPSNAKMMPDVSQEQAWVVTHDVGLAFHPIASLGATFETTNLYKIRSITVADPNSRTPKFFANAVDGNTVVTITPHDH